MAKAKQARWECPNGHPAVLAPQRPRRDDVRRYCLECSKATGRLVERVAPAVQRQRQQRAESAAAKRKRRAEAERRREEAKVTVRTVNAAGQEVMVNVAKELDAMHRRVQGRRWGFTGELTIEKRGQDTRGFWTTGRAWTYHRIHLRTFDGERTEELLETLFHELVHYLGHGGGPMHGPGFRESYAKKAPKAFPGVGRIIGKRNGWRRQCDDLTKKLERRTLRQHGEGGDDADE